MADREDRRQTGWQSSLPWIIYKFSLPAAAFSAVLANVPLVCMLIPPIVEYGRRVNIAPSKMLMPLSFSSLLGGLLTIIGSATNIVVLSLGTKSVPELKIGFFEVGKIGLPVTLTGLIYMITLSSKLLPDRLAMELTHINAREYNLVLVVQQKSSLARKSVEEGGLCLQPGLVLVQIERDGVAIPDPGPDFVILPKDQLHFVGVIDSLLSLTRLGGLTLAEEEGKPIDLNRLTITHCLVEAVVASKSPMVNKQVQELQFRTRYNAAVVAVHRHGTRLKSSIGRISLEAGDCLLMVAEGSEFVSKHRNNSTFALVSQLPGFSPIQRKKAAIAGVVMLVMIIVSSWNVPLITASLAAAALMMTTGCLTSKDLLAAIDIPVLIMISSGFGISKALVRSGAAELLGRVFHVLTGSFGMWGLLAGAYTFTSVFSCAITNFAAVNIMFPVVLAAAQAQHVDFKPFALVLMVASSAGLMTPAGCPTNMMVYVPGGYRFGDYVRYGGPLQLLLLFVTVGVALTEDWWMVWSICLASFLVVSSILAAKHEAKVQSSLRGARVRLPADNPFTSADDDFVIQKGDRLSYVRLESDVNFSIPTVPISTDYGTDSDAVSVLTTPTPRSDTSTLSRRLSTTDKKSHEELHSGGV